MALACLGLASALTVAGLSRLQTVAARWIAVGTPVLSAALIQIPFFARPLHLAPLHAEDWALALLGALLGSLPVIGNALSSRRTDRRRIQCPPTP